VKIDIGRNYPTAVDWCLCGHSVCVENYFKYFLVSYIDIRDTL
jgi:hypothetical protein